MPELPDLTVYAERLSALVVGQPLEQLRLGGPFFLRTVEPRPADLLGHRVVAVQRYGKRIAIELDDELFAVIHLMIAGRLRWRARGCTLPKKRGLAAFDFPAGTLLVTEEGSKKRASLHLVSGLAALEALCPEGIDPLTATEREFVTALTGESHTLKRALTDQHLIAGIGNAYSDEILFAARLSPVQLTTRLDQEDLQRLYEACRRVLQNWTATLRSEVGDGFPENVTAFRESFSVHGRFGEPCPECETKVQRIVRGAHDTHYGPTCQTGGKLLADRALSRLLGKDWPKTLDELEQRKAQRW